MAAAYNNSSTDAAARDEVGAAHLRSAAGLYPDGVHAAANDGRGAAAEKGNVHFFELPRRGVRGLAAGRGEMLPYPAQTTAAAAYYHSGAVAGEALARPLASQVFGGKTTTVPAAAVDVGQEEKGAGAFTERLRHGLPVLGLSVASLAVAGLAAGEPTPAAAFGLFLMLIVGLSAVTIRATRA